MEQQKPQNLNKSAENHVKVVIRVRPLIKEELTSRPDAKIIAAHVHPDKKRITLSKEGIPDHEFSFNHTFSHDKASQEYFYSTIGTPLIEDLFNGYNSTIIAYGQVSLSLKINKIDWFR